MGYLPGWADDALRYEHIVRENPVPLEIHVLRIDLQAPGIALQAVIGPRPAPGTDGEVLMSDPLALARDADLHWAVNTTPWGYPDGRKSFPSTIGEAADISGWALADGETHSTTCRGCWEFWLDADGQARIGNVDDHPDEIAVARLGVGGFQGLVRNGESLVRQPSGQRAPRSAMGLDQESRILTWVVVDKGISAGAPGWRDVMDHFELAELMIELGCWNAFNLDGGGSSVMIRRDDTDPDAPQWVAVNAQSRHYRRPLPMVLGVRRTSGP